MLIQARGITMLLRLGMTTEKKNGNEHGEKKMNAIKTLDTIASGWSESRPGGLLCNPSDRGGIIDLAIVSGDWFVIFNDGRPSIEGLESRDDAVEAFAAELAS